MYMSIYLLTYLLTTYVTGLTDQTDFQSAG